MCYFVNRFNQKISCAKLTHKFSANRLDERIFHCLVMIQSWVNLNFTVNGQLSKAYSTVWNALALTSF